MVRQADQDVSARAAQRSSGPLARGYAPLAGIPDEFIGLDGQPREVWSRFLDAFSGLSPDEITRRFSSADRHMREAGVTYRAPGESVDRTWPLSHVPLLIDQAEWTQISAAITQRAQLLEMVLADIYGPGHLIAEGALPAAVVAGSPEFLRPLCGVKPPGGKYLKFYAADLGRGPDGRWWVLSDRTQAPSGLGYALENRLVMSRALTDLYQAMNVERVAPFFEAFRESLRASADRDEPRIGLLTPGPFSATYAEHAILARYLGFLLVEGDDLTVANDRVHVRTVAGLKRIDVLMRLIDSNSLDPIELDAGSKLGVPGLIDVIRKQAVVVSNMPGSGVIEARALLGFLPSLARRFLGEGLKMPHIATWWCGQPAARVEVLERLDALVIDGAFSGTLSDITRPGAMLPAEMELADRERLIRAIKTRGVDFVGQEQVRLSTTPVWTNGQLSPRPFVLRVLAAATPDGWAVMPGGFCRIADQPDALAVSMGEGARAADVWVVADRTVEVKTLLPAADRVQIRRIAGWVPSRAADNLFWLGRYMERAEATLRLVRALSDPRGDPTYGAAMDHPSRERLCRLLSSWGAMSQTATSSRLFVASDALQGRQYGSALSLLRSAKRTATFLRERLSPEAWQLITEIPDRAAREISDEEGVVRSIDFALQGLAGFAGLAQENMNRAAGWRFLEMGRRVERGINTTRYAREFSGDNASSDDLDTLLTLVDCQITYRSRYLIAPLLAPVRDLVILDPYNPRSVAFQVQALTEHITRLQRFKENGLIEVPERHAVALQASLVTPEAASFNDKATAALEHDLLGIADVISAHYFPHGSNATRAEKLVGLA